MHGRRHFDWVSTGAARRTARCCLVRDQVWRSIWVWCCRWWWWCPASDQEPMRCTAGLWRSPWTWLFAVQKRWRSRSSWCLSPSWLSVVLRVWRV
ncbi:uncharacterized protein BDW47DRAFT_105412 [Aspergillus candidus]|uniref:Uncharacterized protein n=1 Tax=Aspergillus candidus TaxID=41067 RepID=A0A2I2FC05_ASPCN|nr:hypothetical protein BDW47DRAFT_105412 [Aspergillus candidus]PLB38159.1 hypothetical protein BDW47DRAFT_105412 [Aspergillus candidus]